MVLLENFSAIVGMWLVLMLLLLFRNLGFSHSNLNSNFIILVPKVESTIFVDQFKPIAFGNFLFKVITKIILPNQFGFVKGRASRDYVVGALECFNYLDKVSYGGNFALKIDIQKGFDSICWEFILEMLRSFGFSSRFVGCISQNFQFACISILVNGSPHGYFGCSRGVCQGDPLSTLLFILAEDLLSRYLSNMVTLVDLVLMSSKRSINAPSHFLYTDDVLLFARASVSNLTNIVEAFCLYDSFSGQDVNLEKLFIFLKKETTQNLKV